MKKNSILIFALVFVLSGCGLLSSQPTADPNIVATLVAETMSAVPTSALPTVSLPTPESYTPTIVTATLEEQETSTPTPTTTTLPGDPALSLGNPGFFDTFSSGTSFGLAAGPYEDEAVQIEVEDGAMVFSSHAVKGGKRWRLTSRNPNNLYLEGTFTTRNCSGKDQYGLVFRAPTYGDGIGYYLAISCDGNFTLQRWDKSDIINVTNWTTSSHLNAGSNQTNRIGVMAVGDKFKIYLNGILEMEVNDNGLLEKGYIGAFISAIENSSFTVELEEISLWSLP